MYAILSVLILIASVLLIGVVLIQKSKGGGLAASASGYNQIMGVRKTTDFVEKATWTLALFICLASILTAFVVPTSTGDNKGVSLKAATEQTQGVAIPTNGGDKAAPAAAEQAPAAEQK